MVPIPNSSSHSRLTCSTRRPVGLTALATIVPSWLLILRRPGWPCVIPLAGGVPNGNAGTGGKVGAVGAGATFTPGAPGVIGVPPPALGMAAYPGIKGGVASAVVAAAAGMVAVGTVGVPAGIAAAGTVGVPVGATVGATAGAVVPPPPGALVTMDIWLKELAMFPKARSMLLRWEISKSL